jgi:Transglutaminase-like superfamily/Coenzyme PQQ synthesis protein D (PqqD)
MQTLQTQMTVAIKPGVYFGLLENVGLVLDLIGDQYVGLSESSARIWIRLQRGLPLAAIAEEIADEDAVSRETAADMLVGEIQTWEETGLLTRDPGANTAAVPELRGAGAPAQVEVNVEGFRQVPSVLDVARFATASLWAAIALRRRGLLWTLKCLQAISVERSGGGEAERARRIAAVVRADVLLRRLFHQRHRDGPPRSVALTAALRRRGIHAEICFGARARPFAAHAWVEVDGMAIHEELENLRHFTVLARF